jgi:integrase
MSSARKTNRTLRLFDDSAVESDLWPGMTLTAFIDRFVAPIWLVERHDSQLTSDDYVLSGRYWAVFTDDPPLDRIRDEHTSRFVAGLFAMPGRGSRPDKPIPASPYTVRRHVRNIQTAMRLAGPRSEKFPKAQRLLDEVPYIERPEVDDLPPEDVFTLPEIARILEATGEVNRPQVAGVPTWRWWAALVLFTYNVPERKQAILGLRYDKLPAEGEIIRFERLSRKGRKKSKELPFKRAAREAAESIRTPRDLVFPWPHCPRHFYTIWHRILAAAGLPKSRWFGLHGLRKANATESAQINALAPQLSMGHGDFRTTTRYLNRRIMDETADKLPQPQWRPPTGPKQLRLF